MPALRQPRFTKNAECSSGAYAGGRRSGTAGLQSSTAGRWLWRTLVRDRRLSELVVALSRPLKWTPKAGQAAGGK